MRTTVGAFSPNVSGPIRASPESLTTTRLNRGFDVMAAPSTRIDLRVPLPGATLRAGAQPALPVNIEKKAARRPP